MTKRLSLAAVLLLFGFSVHAQNQPPIKEWNFLVYVNGVNSLDSFGSMNINQMEEIGSTDKMNILVEWGSETFKTGKRLLIKKDNEKNKVTSPVVSEVQNPDFGSPQQLSNFIDWAHKNYPAKKYFIVVWNHGSGWHKSQDNPLKLQDISYDERTGNTITTEQLGEVMAHAAQTIGHKVDIYGSDACLMGMIEVASEMSESVSYFLGSQELEPGEGWPYNVFLSKWQSNMEQSPADVAKLLSKEFTAAYSGGIYGNVDATMSVLDLNQIAPFQTAMAQFASELKTLNLAQMPRVQETVKQTKKFFVDYFDIGNFLDNLDKNSITTSSASEVRKTFAQLVIANDQNVDNRTHGLSIWIPNASDLDYYWSRYKNLAFQKATAWGDFLTQLLK